MILTPSVEFRISRNFFLRRSTTLRSTLSAHQKSSEQRTTGRTWCCQVAVNPAVTLGTSTEKCPLTGERTPQRGQPVGGPDARERKLWVHASIKLRVHSFVLGNSVMRRCVGRDRCRREHFPTRVNSPSRPGVMSNGLARPGRARGGRSSPRPGSSAVRFPWRASGRRG